MNRCIFLGNLTRDFEFRTGNSGSVARGAMALNKGNDKGADFINLVAFDKTAELMDKYGKKGRKFLFECHVNTGSYEKDGRKVYTTDFVIDRVEFADSKPATEQPQEQALAFTPIPDGYDEDLPFA